MEDFGHLVTDVMRKQRGEQAREGWLDQAMLFSLQAEAAHAIARRDVNAVAYFNGLADGYRDKVSERRRDDDTD